MRMPSIYFRRSAGVTRGEGPGLPRSPRGRHAGGRSAARDVLRYLVGCAALPPGVNRRFDIGGPDVLTYAEMMHRYSEVAGLRPRVLVPVPLLTPRLSSLWVGLVTPVPAGLARPLVESLRNEVVCAEHDIAQYVPDPPEGLLPLDRAIALALRHTREGAVSTRWSSAATPGAPSDPLPTTDRWEAGRWERRAS